MVEWNFLDFCFQKRLTQRLKKIFLTKIGSRIFVKIEVKLLKFLSSIDNDDNNL